MSISASLGRRLYEQPTRRVVLRQPKDTTMKVMVIVKATKNSEAGTMPSEQMEKMLTETMPGEESELEIRPIFEAEEFDKLLTPELRAQDERLRTELERQQKPSSGGASQ